MLSQTWSQPSLCPTPVKVFCVTQGEAEALVYFCAMKGGTILTPTVVKKVAE
jgi:hypothetical protein